jgi:hypothetical protein
MDTRFFSLPRLKSHFHDIEAWASFFAGLYRGEMVVGEIPNLHSKDVG